MELKKGTLQSLLKLNREKLIFIFCSGLLLFILSLPSDSDSLVTGSEAAGQMIGMTAVTGQTAGATGLTGMTGAWSDTSDAGASDSLAVAATDNTYEEEIELRVRNILSGVEGVGEVDVMVALKPAEQNSMFQEEDTQEVLGIIISADGGGSAVVKAEISEAMEALFGLPTHKIKVLKRVKKESEK